MERGAVLAQFLPSQAAFVSYQHSKYLTHFPEDDVGASNLVPRIMPQLS